MASTFKNAGITVPVVDTSAGNLFAAGASSTAVIHALYISNKSTTSSATATLGSRALKSVRARAATRTDKK